MRRRPMGALVPLERIEREILTIREQRVILDAELARRYGVTTKRLNEQVKRNINRFPADFMFQLSWNEAQDLKSHFATLIRGQNVMYRPYAFPPRRSSTGSAIARLWTGSSTSIR